LKYLQSRIDDIAKGAALMTGTSVEYTWDFPWLAPTPVPTLYDFAAATAVDVGIPKNDIKKMTSFGSSDFGCVGYEIPAVNIWFPIAPEGTAGHSDAFRDAAISDFGQNQAILAGKVLAVSAYRVATNTKLLAEIKAEFAKNKK
ncbi:MAG: amidohydrolase, partial [Bacillota bacterium]|nr:amidohydrolase [Bacillota bacterium]